MDIIHNLPWNVGLVKQIKDIFLCEVLECEVVNDEKEEDEAQEE